ncbi:hypothetical protein GCM10009757_50280 [Streptomyces cheonanensis]|uniref:Uncharacterized protein n=1 Tax=Streptomyces cheonanensis TaxID=312720 RepID=A0ABP5H468_9ACTN
MVGGEGVAAGTAAVGGSGLGYARRLVMNAIISGIFPEGKRAGIRKFSGDPPLALVIRTYRLGARKESSR